MDTFIFYDLSKSVIEDDKKSKIDVDLLMNQIHFYTPRKDAIMSELEVGKSIIKELLKIETIYKDLIVIDLYNLEINNFSKDFLNYKIKLKLDPNYYPMVTPDISLYPIIDPILMYEMISQSELDVRNTSKIRNIDYITTVVSKFLLDNKNKLECKLNYEITDLVILLLKNNNYRIKGKETNFNTINTNTKNNGIGYGIRNNITWDVKQVSSLLR